MLKPPPPPQKKSLYLQTEVWSLHSCNLDPQYAAHSQFPLVRNHRFCPSLFGVFNPDAKDALHHQGRTHKHLTNLRYKAIGVASRHLESQESAKRGEGLGGVWEGGSHARLAARRPESASPFWNQPSPVLVHQDEPLFSVFPFCSFSSSFLLTLLFSKLWRVKIKLYEVDEPKFEVRRHQSKTLEINRKQNFRTWLTTWPLTACCRTEMRWRVLGNKACWIWSNVRSRVWSCDERKFILKCQHWQAKRTSVPFQA